MTDQPSARDFALRDPRGPFLLRWIAGSIDLVFAAFTVLLVNRLIPVSTHDERPYLGAAVALVLIVVYFWLPEAFWGATLGKLFVKVRVVDAEGRLQGKHQSWLGTRGAERLVKDLLGPRRRARTCVDLHELSAAYRARGRAGRADRAPVPLGPRQAVNLLPRRAVD